MFHRTSVATIALAWLYLTGVMHAQIVTGTILGTVTDSSKAVLPGATATITSPALPGGRRRSRPTRRARIDLRGWRPAPTR